LTRSILAGVVPYGTQTHPADGTAGLVVTTADRARELADGEGVARIVGTGAARVGKAEMPKAPVPAAKAALDEAGLGFEDLDAVTTHNPFAAVDDLWFAGQMGVLLDPMNLHGCSPFRPRPWSAWRLSSA
jgi:acetyl-CoA C-acetyltransferase